jgi:hypothetical protein
MQACKWSSRRDCKYEDVQLNKYMLIVTKLVMVRKNVSKTTSKKNILRMLLTISIKSMPLVICP